MNRVTHGSALTLIAALLAAPALAKTAPSGEAQLARLLEGRTAGKPEECISLSTSQETQVIDRTAIVYGSGKTIYVNRPNDARSLSSDDVMVIKITGSQLCHLDLIHMHDRTSHMATGFVGLEQFVPWTRAPKPAAVATAKP